MIDSLSGRLVVTDVTVTANSYTGFDSALENIVNSLALNTVHILRFMNSTAQAGIAIGYMYSNRQYCAFLYMGTGGNGFVRFRFMRNSTWADSVSLY